MTAPTRRVLFVSYVFPPLGGVGVQRTAGFVRHLEDAYRRAWTAYASGQLHRDDAVRARAAC